MAKYKWVEGCRLPLDPQIVGTELEKIRKKNNGELTREIVLKEAENIKSPLHEGFEWDDTEAAKQYRLVQAGYMIRHVVISFEDPTDEIEHEIRAFVSVIQEGNEKPSFTSMRVAMGNPELRSQVFQKALNEINKWKRKYQHLTLFARIFAEVDTINDMIADSYQQKTHSIRAAREKIKAV